MIKLTRFFLFCSVLKLAAFDFDNTLIDVNSDTYIDKLSILSEKDEQQKLYYKYPEHFENESHWTYRMNAVFAYLHTEHNITENDIRSCMREIKLDASMIDLVRELNEQRRYELIIISDANTVFIDTILRANNIDKHFSTVYTNPARFDLNGRLTVRPFNDENCQILNSCLSPDLCASNICKGSILKHHLEIMKERNITSGGYCQDISIFYFGDGRNDYCPGLFLKSTDYNFIRKGYSLERMLQSKPSYLARINAKIHYWNSAADILNIIT